MNNITAVIVWGLFVLGIFLAAGGLDNIIQDSEVSSGEYDYVTSYFTNPKTKAQVKIFMKDGKLTKGEYSKLKGLKYKEEREISKNKLLKTF